MKKQKVWFDYFTFLWLLMWEEKFELCKSEYSKKIKIKAETNWETGRITLWCGLESDSFFVHTVKKPVDVTTSLLDQILCNLHKNNQLIWEKKELANFQISKCEGTKKLERSYNSCTCCGCFLFVFVVWYNDRPILHEFCICCVIAIFGAQGKRRRKKKKNLNYHLAQITI